MKYYATTEGYLSGKIFMFALIRPIVGTTSIPADPILALYPDLATQPPRKNNTL
jgi:hypothetical protein